MSDTHPNAPKIPDKLLLSLPETCTILGFSLRHGYDLVKRGEFPVTLRRIGNRWKISRAELEQWLEAPHSA